jgi:hypothetical protein
VLSQELASSRNPDGGWGYYRGKRSRIEPTAWALLAWQALGRPTDVSAVRSWTRQDGLVRDDGTGQVNLGFNGLLGVMLSAIAPTSPELPPLWRSLMAARGIKLPQVESNRQDNSLQGWPWVPGTFSWVEPTALCLLCLLYNLTLPTKLEV